MIACSTALLRIDWTHFSTDSDFDVRQPYAMVLLSSVWGFAADDWGLSSRRQSDAVMSDVRRETPAARHKSVIYTQIRNPDYSKMLSNIFNEVNLIEAFHPFEFLKPYACEESDRRKVIEFDLCY
jgi:hypothetical protein